MLILHYIKILFSNSRRSRRRSRKNRKSKRVHVEVKVIEVIEVIEDVKNDYYFYRYFLVSKLYTLKNLKINIITASYLLATSRQRLLVALEPLTIFISV